MFKRVILAAIKVSTLFIVAIVSLWLAFFVIYMLLPSSLTDMASEDFTSVLEDTYKPVTRSFYKEWRDYWSPSPPWEQSSANPVLGAISTWSIACNGPNSSPYIAKITGDGSSISWRLSAEQASAKTETDRLKRANTQFTVVIIILGMLTTIFAGLNSSQYAQSGQRRASFIKIAAIFFPAAVTAATALGSLFASQDQISKQNQIYFGLVNLASEISSQLALSSCPTSALEAAPIEKSMSDWGRRIGEIAVGAATSDNKKEDGGDHK